MLKSYIPIRVFLRISNETNKSDLGCFHGSPLLHPIRLEKKNNEVPMKSQFTPDMDRKCYNMLQPHGCGSPGISHDFTLYGVNAPIFSCRNPHHHGFACSDHINETKIAAAATQQAVHGMGISCPSWASCNW